MKLVVEIISDVQHTVCAGSHEYEAEHEKQSHGPGKGPVSQLQKPPFLPEADVQAGVGFFAAQIQAASSEYGSSDDKNHQSRQQSSFQIAEYVLCVDSVQGDIQVENNLLHADAAIGSHRPPGGKVAQEGEKAQEGQTQFFSSHSHLYPPSSSVLR
ncbi:unknown [Clostridium sp. CAG:149]|nr:unknown [Clostridium sp. CAG:149]